MEGRENAYRQSRKMRIAFETTVSSQELSLRENDFIPDKGQELIVLSMSHHTST